MNNISGIYQIQSKIKPNRIYIGSAVCINKRWIAHLSDLRLYKHGNQKLQNHYNKYGESDLQFSILLSCDKEDLLKIEQYFIDSYNPYFNICKKAGSTLGRKMSDEARLKMKKAWETRLPVSDETRKKQSINGKNRKHSNETKLKISNSHKGIIFSIEHRKNISIARKGTKASEETKQKLREASKNKIPISKESMERGRLKRIGLKRSPQTCLNISKAKKGKPAWNKGIKSGKIPWNKGCKTTPEIKKKISDSRKLYYIKKRELENKIAS